MSFTQENIPDKSGTVAILPIVAAVVALIGLGDAIYLTVHHYTATPVPCSMIQGCEQVLTSAYAEIAGIPLALFGAAAYFTAFSLAILAAFGRPKLWPLFGLQVAAMSAFTLWLLYLQQFVIGAFCQFCLISAAVTFTLLVIFIASKIPQKIISFLNPLRLWTRIIKHTPSGLFL